MEPAVKKITTETQRRHGERRDENYFNYKIFFIVRGRPGTSQQSNKFICTILKNCLKMLRELHYSKDKLPFGFSQRMNNDTKYVALAKPPKCLAKAPFAFLILTVG